MEAGRVDAKALPNLLAHTHVSFENWMVSRLTYSLFFNLHRASHALG